MGLGPGGRRRGVGMDDPADLGEGPGEDQVGRRVRRRPGRAGDLLAVGDPDHDDVLEGERRDSDPAGLDRQ